MIVGVIVDLKIINVDRIWDYFIDTKKVDNIQIGMKVKVPFNKSLINGYIVKIYENNYNPDVEILEVFEVFEQLNFLSKREINISKWLHLNYFSKQVEYLNLFSKDYSDHKMKKVLKVKDINTLNPEEQEIYVKNNFFTDFNKYGKDKRFYIDYEIIEINRKQNRFLTRICDDNTFNAFYLKQKSQKIREMMDLIKNGETIKITSNILSKTLLNRLIENNIAKLKITTSESLLINSDTNDIKTYELNYEQKQISNNINLNEFSMNVIKGVTGSGKTMCYIDLINKVINKGKTVLLLIPEVGLSYSIYKEINKYIPKTYLFHSKVSNNDKQDIVNKIKNDNVNVIVGTRSSLFLPLKNMGLIIFDEEHDNDYYQINSPRYDSKELAKLVAKNDEFPIILGSATPSIKTFLNVYNGNYNYFELNKTYNKTNISNQIIVNSNNDILDEKIIKLINSNKGQSVLLWNKKAYARVLSCSLCDYVDKCNNCGTPRKVYLSKGILKCNYCQSTKDIYTKCLKCHHDSLVYKGKGIEQIYEYLVQEFPNKKIVFIDGDIMSSNKKRKEIIDKINNFEVDIILGTQIIAKGFDFKNISLGVIIDSNSALNFPSFDAKEQTFNLFNQFLGRVGRHCDATRIIQTKSQEQTFWNQILNNDYDTYAYNELVYRKKYNMIPFVNLFKIHIDDQSFENCFTKIINVSNRLKSNNINGVWISEINAPLVSKINGKFRLQFSITCSNINLNKLKISLFEIKKEMYKYNINITYNPNNIL